MRVLPKSLRYRGHERPFYYGGSFTRGESRAVRDSKNMRIHRDRGFSEGSIQNYIGRLAPNAGQLF